jgi:ATP-binding cassette subfamily B protein
VEPQQANNKPLDHLPPELLAKVTAEVSVDAVQLCAPYDLDTHGRYSDAYLVLANGRLGDFRRQNGDWIGRWVPTADVKEAKIVEGLGMGILRLWGDGKVLDDFRFTLRNAKAVAKIQRAMERKIEGKTDEAEPLLEPPKPDEKKVRCEKCGRVIPTWSETCPGCTSRRKVLSRLMDFVRPYRARAITGFVLALLVTVMGLIRPALTKPLVDQGLGLGRGATPDAGQVILYTGIMACLAILSACAGGFRERLMAILGSRIARDVRDKTYAHLHKLSLSFFSKRPTGSLVTRITSDSDRIWDFVAFTVIEAIMSFLTIIGVGVALFILNWKLACVVLLPVPLMFFLTFYFHGRLHIGFDRLWHKWSQMTSIVADALPGVRVIKAFGQERREVDRFARKNSEFFQDEVGMISLWTLFGPVMGFCTQVGSVLVWVVGGVWVIHDYYNLPPGQGITAGTLMAFVGYMWMFYGPIHMIAHMDRMLNRAASSVQRIFEVLDTEPVIYSRSGAVKVERIQGRIELRDVSFSYDGIRKVLRNVNLKVDAGTMVGLAGPSGGGKTTMVNLICRFYDVLEGQILVDGVDVRDYDVESLRRKIGVVLQEPFLFHGTVGQNIAYGHPEATMERIIESARAANAHDFIVGFPDGYDTLVGERGHTLSGGERQRISISRAILNNPTILILDEATSSVDTETEKLIQEALARLVANRTTIAIAHRLSTLRRANSLIILDKGEIKEQGAHDELAGKEDGVYAKMIKTQTEMQSIIAIAG